ncbi:amino acid adenylation domain-containing protein [Photorhabdus temperata]|nr:non-ribosomal peptide synthetase [Photorhabdus temperata]MCT8347108.1 amino acid adenylation domain-containing protein [Photorhabdus temperata]
MNLLNQEHQLLHLQFEEAANNYPNHIAVTFNCLNLTYSELQQRSTRLAQRLISAGVKTEDVVGIYLERSPEMIISMLGILKAGAAYLPLPPDYPSERLSYMIEDAGAVLVLVNQSAEAALPFDTSLSMFIDEEGGVLSASLPELQPHNLAYVIYTSGSTGKPKGVAVSHEGAVNLVSPRQDYVHFGPEETVLQLAPMAFDASAFEIWSALVNGARLVLASPSYQALDELPKCLIDQKISTLLLTPALFHVLVDHRPESLDNVRQLIVGGDAMSARHARKYISRKLTDRKVFLFNNVYGPTEGTTLVSSYPMINVGAEASRLPLGNAIEGAKLYLLDPALRQVEPGEYGEIYIGGLSLARGYINKPGLTSLHFIPDPFSHLRGARMFATGDIGQLSEEGLIEFIGRFDDQVKVRGHRVELAEIEKIIESYPMVSSVCVVLSDQKEGQSAQLIAHLTVNIDTVLTDDILTRHIKDKLPEYMCPNRFIIHSQLPLTSSGKTDRKKLASWENEKRADTSVIQDELTPAEVLLAKIWSNILGPFKVSPEADFFALGGDSLLAIQIIAEAEKKGLMIDLARLFKSPTLREVCQGLTPDNLSEGNKIETVNSSLISHADQQLLPLGIEAAYPATRLQLGMLFEGLLSSKTIYLDVISRHINLPLNEHIFRDVLQELAFRHPSLRIRFDLATFSEPMQLVESLPSLPLKIESYAGKEQEDIQLLHEKVVKQLSEQFDPEIAPLMRVHAAVLDDRKFKLSYSFHHAILDGWSESVFIFELLQLYKARLEGTSILLEKPVSPEVFVRLEREVIQDESARVYFSRYHGRGKKRANPTAHYCKVSASVPADTAGLLHDKSSQWGIPLKSIFFTAFFVTVANQLSDRTPIVGMSVNGRPEALGADLTLGLFLNHVPLTLDLTIAQDWHALARQAFDVESQILHYRRFPYSEVQKIIGGSPFEAAFSYVHFHRLNELLESGMVDDEEDMRDHTSLPIRVEVINERQGYKLSVDVTADENCFGDGFSEKFVVYMLKVINTLALASDEDPLTYLS